MEKNVLLINRNVPEYQQIVDNINNLSTLAIVYDEDTTSDEILVSLQSKFQTIERLAICFFEGSSMFLDGNTFFDEEEEELSNSNVVFVMSLINTFQIQTVDFFASYLLSYWQPYLTMLATATKIGASEDRTGIMKYSPDWNVEDDAYANIYFKDPIDLFQKLYVPEKIVPKWEDLIYDSLKKDCSNVFLIDKRVTDYQQIVDSLNADTFAVAYCAESSKEKLLQLLESKFVSFGRLAICFLENTRYFLDNESFLDNTEFLIQIIQTFQIETVDFLACNTLQNDTWKQFFTVLGSETSARIGASDNRTGNVKYGGDWVMESTNEDIESVYFNESIGLYQYLLDAGEENRPPSSKPNPVIWKYIPDSSGCTIHFYRTITGQSLACEYGRNSSANVFTFTTNVTTTSNTQLNNYAVSNIDNSLSQIRIPANTTSTTAFHYIKLFDADTPTNYTVIGFNYNHPANPKIYQIDSINNRIKLSFLKQSIEEGGGRTFTQIGVRYIPGENYLSTAPFPTSSLFKNQTYLSVPGGVTERAFGSYTLCEAIITNDFRSGNSNNLSTNTLYSLLLNTNSTSYYTQQYPMFPYYLPFRAGAGIYPKKPLNVTSTRDAGNFVFSFSDIKATDTDTISSYRVSTDGWRTTYTIATISSTSLTIQNESDTGLPLVAGTIYSVMFLAINGVGEGIPCEAQVYSITGTPTVPDNPSFTINFSERSVSMSYSSATKSITGFKWQYTTSTSPDRTGWRNEDLGVSSNDVSNRKVYITGVTAPLTDNYTIYVLAMNSTTTSSSVSAKMYKHTNVYFDIPNPPTAVSIDNATTSSLRLNYTNSTTLGVSSTYYYSINDATYSGTISNPVSITSLNQATLYSVKMKSIIGSNNYSSETSYVYAYTLPNAPTPTLSMEGSVCTVNYVSNNTTDSASTLSYWYSTDGGTSFLQALTNPFNVSYSPSISIIMYAQVSGSQAATARSANSEAAVLQQPTFGTFSAISKTYLTDTTFVITDPTSNSQGSFTYTISPSSVATITNGNTVNIQGAGTATLTATQSSSGNFLSGSTSTSLVVAQASPSFSDFPTSILKTYLTDTTFVITDPVSNSLGAFTYTIEPTSVATITNGNTVNIQGAGTATLTATQSSSGNFSSGTTTASLLVALASPTLSSTFQIPTKPYQYPQFDLTPPGSNSDGTWTFTSSDLSVASISDNGQLIPVNAGTATITATQSTTINFLSAVTTTTFTCTQISPTVGTFSLPQSVTYGDSNSFELQNPSSNSSGSWSYTTQDTLFISIDNNTVTLLKPGNASITASQSSDTNFVAFTSAPTSLTINAPDAPVLNSGTYSSLQLILSLSTAYNQIDGFTYTLDNGVTWSSTQQGSTFSNVPVQESFTVSVAVVINGIRGNPSNSLTITPQSVSELQTSGLSILEILEYGYKPQQISTNIKTMIQDLHKEGTSVATLKNYFTTVELRKASLSTAVLTASGTGITIAQLPPPKATIKRNVNGKITFTLPVDGSPPMTSVNVYNESNVLLKTIPIDQITINADGSYTIQI